MAKILLGALPKIFPDRRLLICLTLTLAPSFPPFLISSFPPSPNARAHPTQVVLLADGSGAPRGSGLRTCALRPGHLFGERDAILDFFTRLPASVSARGVMTMMYVGNAAAVHILAARRLLRERSGGLHQDPRVRQPRDQDLPLGGSGGGGWRPSFSSVLSGRAVNVGDFDESFSAFYGRQLQPPQVKRPRS